MYLGRRRSRGGHLGLGVPDEAGNVKGPLALALGALVKPEKRQLLNNSLGNIFHADLMVQISKIHIFIITTCICTVYTRWGGHLFRRFCKMYSESS